MAKAFTSSKEMKRFYTENDDRFIATLNTKKFIEVNSFRETFAECVPDELLLESLDFVPENEKVDFIGDAIKSYIVRRPENLLIEITNKFLEEKINFSYLTRKISERISDRETSLKLLEYELNREYPYKEAVKCCIQNLEYEDIKFLIDNEDYNHYVLAKSDPEFFIQYFEKSGVKLTYSKLEIILNDQIPRMNYGQLQRIEKFNNCLEQTVKYGDKKYVYDNRNTLFKDYPFKSKLIEYIENDPEKLIENINEATEKYIQERLPRNYLTEKIIRKFKKLYVINAALERVDIKVVEKFKNDYPNIYFKRINSEDHIRVHGFSDAMFEFKYYDKSDIKQELILCSRCYKEKLQFEKIIPYHVTTTKERGCFDCGKE